MMKKALLLECFLMTNPNTATKVRDQMRNSANVQECDASKAGLKNRCRANKGLQPTFL